jgi:hypothetical protein
LAFLSNSFPKVRGPELGYVNLSRLSYRSVLTSFLVDPANLSFASL